MKFVATADWQLGMTARFLPAEARARYHEARLDAVRRIGEIAAEHAAAFVVVAGDVFESNQLDRAIVERAFDALRGIETPVWLLPGNHDPLDIASIYRSPEFTEHCPEHVRVLDRAGVFDVQPGVQLLAAPWFSKRPLSDLVSDAVAAAEPAEGHRIVVGHGAVWSADASDPAAIDAQRAEEAARAGLIDLAVLGDRHSTEQVSPHVWYPGTPEVTDRREIAPGNVLVFDLADPTRPERVRVGRWVFDTLDAELTCREDVDDLIARLDRTVDRRRRARWLRLSGTLTLADKARLDAAIERQAETYAFLDHWERHTDLAVLPDDGELGDLGLNGFALDAVNELRERAPSDPVASDALSLLYRLTRGGA